MDMCLNERDVKESMIWGAIKFEDKDLEAKAKQIKLKSCLVFNIKFFITLFFINKNIFKTQIINI
jgi:hypothetical protein